MENTADEASGSVSLCNEVRLTEAALDHEKKQGERSICHQVALV